MPEIKTTYSAKIHYRRTDACQDAKAASQRVARRAMKFVRIEKSADLRLEWFNGCEPYVKISSPNRAQIERVAGKIERYINKLKAVELCPTG